MPTTDPQAPPAGGKRCSKCGKVKPLDAFYLYPEGHRCGGRRQSWCRTCVRIGVSEHQRTPEFRAWLASYLARPDVKARRRESDARRAEKRKALKNAFNATPLGRLLNGRRKARARLRGLTDPDRVARAERLVAQYDAEIARARAALDGGPDRPARRAAAAAS